MKNKAATIAFLAILICIIGFAAVRAGDPRLVPCGSNGKCFPAYTKCGANELGKLNCAGERHCCKSNMK